MSLRTYLAIGAALLLALPGCDDEETSEDGGHGSHVDGGGHDDHQDAGDDHSGGDCLHTGAAIECESDIDTVGASVSEGDITIEVTGATPEDPMAGAEESNTLMVKISDAAGDPVTGATLESVFTEAHGGHESCGAPELMEMEDGMYHVRGLTYPHGGTWHHAFMVGDDELDLEVCVMNEEGAEDADHGG